MTPLAITRKVIGRIVASAIGIVVLGRTQSRDYRRRHNFGKALGEGWIVQTTVLSCVAGFVRDLDEGITFLERDASDLADMGLVVEGGPLRIGKRDDLERKATSPGEVEQFRERGAAGFWSEAEQVTRRHEHADDCELPVCRPIQVAGDIRFASGRDHLRQSERSDTAPRERSARGIDKAGALNPEREYGVT